MAAMVVLEFVWWGLAYAKGIAPFPYLGTYLVLAATSLGAALALRAAFRRDSTHMRWTSLAAATLLVAIGASLFLPLKYAIPGEIPFWLDRPVAGAEQILFGAQPWAVLDAVLGRFAVPIDRIYGLWLPIQSLVLFTVILARPGPAKSRALVAYALAWFVLGIVAAVLLSSAGPLFHDRLFGTAEFGGLHERLAERGAWIAMTESEAMWASYATGEPGMVSGISAVPSMHVAISLWFVLAARTLAPRAAGFALAYLVFMWIASVQLGWHYAFDGLAGIAGMAAVWVVAGKIEPWLVGWVATRPSRAAASPAL